MSSIMKKYFHTGKILFLFFLAVFPFLLSADDLKIPALTGRIVDETFTLTEADKSALADELKKLETEKGVQIAVLVVDTVGELTIEEYGIKAAEAWKLGRKDVSDGAILIVALKDKKMRIEVGRGLEGFLTDLRTKQIQEKIIKPEFKKGNFSGGIRLGTEAMITLARGAELPLPENNTDSELDWGSLAALIFLCVCLGIWIQTLLYNLIWRIFIAVLFIFFLFKLGGFLNSFPAPYISAGAGGFFMILPVIFRSKSSSRHSGGSSGFFSFGSSSSDSGSSGGFFGGGGDFGGGGSSSSWD